MEDRHGVSASVIIRMVEEAMNNNWDLPEDMGIRIPEILYSIATDPEESTRNRINASNSLVKIKEQKTEALNKAAKWALDLATGGTVDALAHRPPFDGESMIDDRPQGSIEVTRHDDVQ